MRSFENRNGTGPGHRAPASVGRKETAAKLRLSTALHHGAHDASPVVGIAVLVLGVNEGLCEVGAGRFDAAWSLADFRHSRFSIVRNRERRYWMPCVPSIITGPVFSPDRVSMFSFTCPHGGAATGSSEIISNVNRAT